MNDAILIAIISSVIPLIGTIITVLYSANKTDEKIKINQAVMEAKLEELTREVRLHNDFAQRVPVLETKVEHLEKESNK
jgi:hypothetical protein